MGKEGTMALGQGRDLSETGGTDCNKHSLLLWRHRVLAVGVLLTFTGGFLYGWFHSDSLRWSLLVEKPPQPHLGNISRDLDLVYHDTQTSTAHVLKKTIKFAASDLDRDSFINQKLFPPVGVVRDKRCECKKYPIEPEHTENLVYEWHRYIDNDIHKTRHCEFIQEVGFIEFFRHNYPRMFLVIGTDDGDDAVSTNHTPNFIPKLNSQEDKIDFRQLRSLNKNLRLLLPLCPVLERTNTRNQFRIAADKATARLLQAGVRPHNIFHVAAHPSVSETTWQAPIRNIRRLQIDATIVGSMSDVLIPVGSSPHLCNYSRDDSRYKTNLIYGCGSEHSKRYQGWRSKLFETFAKLNKTDVDASTKRSKEDYANGFFRSMFCFVVPGDTIATSQATRAMVAGCVPVFLVADFRELPFSNVLDYSQFSIRMHGNDLLLNDQQHSGLRFNAASNLYDRLQSMVTSGEYDRMLGNVRIARDFFNYHRFGSRSPYGLAMVSIYQNEIDESQQ